MPVKCTGLPAELISVPPALATSACQAAQPRCSSQGRRIASPKPGSGAASGLRMTSRSPLAASAPALQPAAKPRLRPLRRTSDRGASLSTASGVPSPESLSTTISSSPSLSSGSSAGRVLASSSRLFQATMRIESDGRTGAEAIRPSAPARVRSLAGYFFLPHLSIRSPYLLFLTFLPF